MKKFIALLTILTGLVSAQAQSSFTVTLDGSQEVPSNGSTATGSGLMTLNGDNTLSYNISYSGLTPSFLAAHIHGPAGVGTNNSVIFGLNNVPINTTSGSLVGTTPALNPTQISQLQASWWYVNIHTTPSFGGGEIRGQILPVPEPSTYALAGLGAAGLLGAMRRRKQ